MSAFPDHRDANGAWRRGPILILGVHGRSGTSFFAELIGEHPDCAVAITEDYLTRHSDLLEQYADTVASRWVPALDPSERDRLLRSLGDGALQFLSARVDTPRLVTKTPTVEGLDRFFSLYPDAYLLLLVRDGRSVVESHARSWFTNRERIAREWAAACRRVLAFDEQHRGGDARYRIVRYEDIVRDLRGELTPILEFLDLDVDRYDFDAAEKAPVFGSSTQRGRQGPVHWTPVQREAGFDPLERWRSWKPAEQALFNHVAGAELEAFGYELVEPSRGLVPAALEHRAIDARWWLSQRAVRVLDATGIGRRLRRPWRRLRRRVRNRRRDAKATVSE